jgi:hypothetical protein
MITIDWGVSHWSSRAVEVISKITRWESKSPSPLQISFFPFRCTFKQAHKMHSIVPRIVRNASNWARKVDFSSVMDSPLQGVWKYVLFYLQHFNTLYLPILHACILLLLIDAIFINTNTCLVDFYSILPFHTHLCCFLSFCLLTHSLFVLIFRQQLQQFKHITLNSCA